jgi:hypothetical protein
MSRFFLASVFLLTYTFSFMTHAADLGFSNITQTEMEAIVNEFTANFAPTTVSSAAPLGKIFGFELGILGGGTKAKNIETYAERSTSEDQPSSLPHAALFGALSLPFGITVEAGAVPSMKVDGGEFKYSFVGAKWTFLDTIIDLAAKVNVAKVGFTFTQTSGGVNGVVDFDDTIQTLMIMASKNFLIIEPYIGTGIIRADGKMKVTGTGTIFDSTYTNSQEATQTPTGNYTVIGANLNLFIIKFGLEFAKTMSTDSVTGKFSIYF